MFSVSPVRSKLHTLERFLFGSVAAWSHAAAVDRHGYLSNTGSSSSDPTTYIYRGNDQPSRELVVTASGPDRPGIVSRLSKIILESGGNVEESRMARLAGDFSILMLITVDSPLPRAAEELRGRLLEIEGLQVNTRWTQDDRVRETKPKRKFRRFSLRGADNPGLVYNVAEYLASNNINIENLETYTQEAPFGGSTLFTMEGIITMPIGFSTKQLIAHLDCLQATLGVEIVLSNLDPLKKAEDYKEWSQNILSYGKSKYSSAAAPPSPVDRFWTIPDVAI